MENTSSLSVKKNSAWAISALIAANLIPLAGVFWMDWDVNYLVLSYWFENLVIGGYTILRMLTAQGNMAIRTPAALLTNAALNSFMVLFFLLHYGGFCGAHGFFLLAFFKESSTGESFDVNTLMSAHDWPGPLVFLDLLFSVLKAVFAHQPPGIWWMIAGLVLSHGVSFVTHYLLRSEYRSATIGSEMSRPYKRIVLLHIAIIAAGIPVMLLKSPLPLLVLIIVGKTLLDLWLHLQEHRHPIPNAQKTVS